MFIGIRGRCFNRYSSGGFFNHYNFSFYGFSFYGFRLSFCHGWDRICRNYFFFDIYVFYFGSGDGCGPVCTSNSPFYTGQLILSRSISLICGQTKPSDSLIVILIYAITGTIQASKIVLGSGITFVCSLAIPECGLLIIFFYAFARVIKAAE